MLGAILGDIIGSQFEWSEQKPHGFPLFTDACRFTDDSVATLAIAAALAEGGDGWQSGGFRRLLIRRMVSLGREYPDVGWGEGFYRWLTVDPTPYGSMGNGAALRRSPVGWVADSEEEVRALSRLVTEVSHDHREAILAAEAVAMAIYLGRCGASLFEIRERMEDYYPEIREMTVEGIRADYGIDREGRFITCAGSVPQAIVCFLEAEDFESAVRNAVSLGGDADTQAAITGSMAEAYFGIPEEVSEEGLAFLDDDLLDIVFAFEEVRRPKA
ncbi:MAG: ADP-ribosylglycohydrolase family protein [Clostridia bacterium]|nr:ADP-ribosylglycohydrolase family protein [Clostridia bacterium]